MAHRLTQLCGQVARYGRLPVASVAMPPAGSLKRLPGPGTSPRPEHKSESDRDAMRAMGAERAGI